MKKPTMKIYVWDDGLGGWYTSGLAIALAESEDEARRMIQDFFWAKGEVPPPIRHEAQVYDLDSPIAFVMRGGEIIPAD